MEPNRPGRRAHPHSQLPPVFVVCHPWMLNECVLIKSELGRRQLFPMDGAEEPIII